MSKVWIKHVQSGQNRFQPPDPVSDGGYNHKFVDQQAATKFECVICTFVARDAQQVTCCGKIYCKTCLEKIRRANSTCPACRALLNSFKDARADQEIRSLHVHCDSVGTEGERCTHRCELRNIDAHYKTCLYVKVPCTNNCGIKIQRNKLAAHLQQDCPQRHVSCIYCGEKGTHEYITGQHCETCVNALLLCPIEDCTEMMKKSDMSTHIDACPHSIVHCDYRHYGCDLPVKRKDLAGHYKSCVDLHLRLAVEKIEQLEISLTRMHSLILDEQHSNKDVLAKYNKRLKTVTLIVLSLVVALIIHALLLQSN